MFTYTEDNPKIATDSATLDRAINSVVKQSAKLGPKLQAVMIACAYHMVEHKDASRMTNLYNALGNSVNKKNGINVWIRAYTSLILKPDKAGVLKFLGKGKEYTFDIEGESVAFYDMPEVEKLQQPFDIVKTFLNLVKKAEGKNEDIKTMEQKSLFAAIIDLAKSYDHAKQA